MIDLKIFLISGVLLIGGCATLSQEDTVSEQTLVTAEKNNTQASTEEVPTEIDADVLYMLLVAELAGQRKQYDIALEGYLRAARRVDDVRLAERAAKIALFLKDEQKADEAVALWLKQDPESLNARKVALWSALRARDADAAIEHLDFLLLADPAGFEETLLEFVRVMQTEGKGAFVYEVLDELAARHPDQEEIAFVQAILAMQMGQNDVALEKVNAALVLRPEWSKALLFQAQVVVQAGDFAAAEDIIRAAIEKDPENDQLKKLLANVLIKSSELEQAASVFRQILKHDPEDEESQYALALVYLQLQKFDAAEELLVNLTTQPRFQSQACLYLGKLEVNKGNIDKGLIWFDKVTNGGLEFEAQVTAISVLMDAERYDEALDRLARIQTQYPDESIRFLLMEAEIYNSQKEYHKAFNLLTTGLQDHPGQKELLYTRSLIAERLGRLDVLEADLKQILASDPDDASALNALGYTLANKTDRLSEAEKYLQRAIELQPGEPVIIDSYGWLLFRQGRLEQSLDYLRRAYNKAKEGEIAAHMVEVLWALGRQREAKELFRQALISSRDKAPLLELQTRIPGLR